MRELNPPEWISVNKQEVAIKATKIGDVSLVTEKGFKMSLTNIYYTPEVRCNILAISLLQPAGINLKIENFTAYLYTKTNAGECIILTGMCTGNNLYCVKFLILQQNTSPQVMLTANQNHKIELLHQQFGHLSYQSMKLLFPKLPIENKICEICLKAKQTHLPFNKEKVRPRSTLFLEKVHTVVDIQPIVSIEGHTCFVTFMEESTHFTHLYNLKSKGDVFYYYQHYKNRMKKLSNRPGIANIHYDNVRISLISLTSFLKTLPKR